MQSKFLGKLTLLAAASFTCTYLGAASVAPVAAENGMVVSAQHLASKVGVDILRQGAAGR